MPVFNDLGTTSPRRWRRLAATVGMSLALVLAAGTPAHATTLAALVDDLESADASTVWESSTGECCAESPNAHSPSHYGFIPPTMYENSWVSLGRPVHLPAVL